MPRLRESRELGGRLVVIDNADMTLNEDIVEEITCDNKNQYFIIANAPWEFCIKPDNYAEIVFDGTNQTYFLKYFKVPGWDEWRKDI